MEAAYYYPETGQVKLTVSAATIDENAPLTLLSQGVQDTDGNAANANETVYLLTEEPIEPGTLGVQSYRFFIGGAPVSEVKERSGVSVLVCVANATGSAQSGTVQVYDGETLCGEATYSVKNEGAVWVTVDTTAHTFSAAENVTILASPV